MKRRHDVPFGTKFWDGKKAIDFHLWSPAVEKVKVDIETFLVPLPLGRNIHTGIHGCSTDVARPGTRYKFLIDGEHEVPDPASRFQPDDVHGPSMVVDPEAFDWQDENWKGRPWEETVLYELHVGTFSPEGTFAGVKERLDHLAELGVTTIELMPLSDFPGRRNWGYDGVLPYAPDSSYGTPENLKDLIQTAHQKGLSVFLDVVYNHFGPEGNYLPLYAPEFFTERHETPWGSAINFSSEHVREFFIRNALYWLEEYHFDGLRLDAVHAILDDSEKHFLTELAERVHAGPGRERHVHLVLENEENEASRLRSEYSAQWNDDVHHALHVALTGEDVSYYSDYADAPVGWLAKCLSDGFAFQGEMSRHRGNRRGEPSKDLPPTKFVAFLQNHDQVGNRALGERITKLANPEAVRAATEIYLLSPQIPMLFMGEEWGVSSPFLFFCDFEGELSELVTKGRREEFSSFPEFSDPEVRERIPDPGSEETFLSSKLRWEERDEPEHEEWFSLYKKLLALRRKEIIPRLKDIPGGESAHRLVGERGLRVQWTLGDGSLLTLLANLSGESLGGFENVTGELLHATDNDATEDERELPPWSVAWYLKGREWGVGSGE
ncbi:MAG: malto-oligosyltrehalose trehalohydrolase [Rubrobacteraceae bacterium]